MKFCTKCGNQLNDDMDFCAKCGAKVISDTDTTSVQNEPQSAINAVDPVKPRKSMLVWMTVFFIFAGIFAIGSIADISMLAGVCLFGILGLMFLVLAKVPKSSPKVLSEVACFKKNNGISKGAFIGVSIFFAFFLFIGIINISDTTDNVAAKETTTVNSTALNESETPAVPVTKEDVKKEPEIPAAFASEIPVTVSVSMYDNIIGLPEIKCHFKNNTDKEIAAVQLYLLPKDVYGEEIHGIFVTNKLQCDTPIPANGAETFTWQMIDQSIKSGDLYIYSVYFADGTEWGDRNASTSTIKKHALKLEAKY